MHCSVLPWARNRLELVQYEVSNMQAAAPDCMTGVQHGSQQSCRPCNHTCNLNRLKLCTQLHQQHTHLSLDNPRSVQLPAKTTCCDRTLWTRTEVVTFGEVDRGLRACVRLGCTVAALGWVACLCAPAACRPAKCDRCALNHPRQKEPGRASDVKTWVQK
jgi:hypothetical protein